MPQVRLELLIVRLREIFHAGHLVGGSGTCSVSRGVSVVAKVPLPNLMFMDASMK